DLGRLVRSGNGTRSAVVKLRMSAPVSRAPNHILDRGTYALRPVRAKAFHIVGHTSRKRVILLGVVAKKKPELVPCVGANRVGLGNAGMLRFGKHEIDSAINLGF